jgi:fucose permease
MRRDPRVVLILAFVGFVSLGLPDGLLGVAWPSLRATFGQPLDGLGPLLVAITAGYVLSSFASGWALARLGVGGLLALSALLTAASLLGWTTTTRFGVVVGLGALAGLGAGAIDAGLNTHMARHHSPRLLNWLHACYGLGAASGPALMTAVLAAGRPWQSGYRLVAAAQIALALAFFATRRRWADGGAQDQGDAAGRAASAAPVSATLRLASARLGMMAFFLYVGLEATVGAWTFSLLSEARGVPLTTAGAWVSGYWAALTAGRVAFGFVASAARLARLLRGCLAAIAAGALLVALDAGDLATLVGLLLIGFACGPVFPSLIAATPARLGAAHTTNAVGFQVAAAAAGQSLIPAAVGVLADARGLAWVPPAVLALAAILYAAHEALAARPLARDPD